VYKDKKIISVVFDFDNTIVDGDYWIVERWKKTIEYVNKKYSIKNFEDTFWKIFNKKGLYYKYHVNDTLIEVSQNPSLVEDIVKYFHKTEIDDIFIKGAFDCINNIKREYLLGVITNGRKQTQLRRIKKAGILNYFNSIICAYDFPKPSKKPFLKCIEELGLHAENIIYIGDSYELDYLPALKIGINPILLDQKGLKEDDHMCHSVRNYKEINKILMSRG
jgi:HAD superfamily hydrolase (TIGR01549 family)